MESTFSRHWPPPPFEFRLACEECHKRKIRCELPVDGTRTTCEACRINDRSCLFSVRSKTGRPRKSVTADHRASMRGRPSVSPNHVVTVLPTAAKAASARKPGISTRMLGNHPTSPTRELSPSSLHSVEMESLEPSTDGAPPWGIATPLASSFSASDVMRDDAFEFLLSDAASIPGLMPLYPTQAEPDMPLSLSAFTSTPRPKTLPLHNAIGSLGTLEMPAARRDEEEPIGGPDEDFSGVLALCIEIHQRSQGSPLDLLSPTDQEQLSTALRGIKDLGHKTQARSLRPTAGLNSRDQYKWMIIRVAVAEAIEIAAGLIDFNISIYHNRTGSTYSLAPPSGSNSTNGAPAAAGRTDADPAKHAGADMQLSSVQTLLTLDHALSNFRHFIYAQEAGGEAQGRWHFDNCPSRASGMMEWESAGTCRCVGLSLARIDRVRGQAWVLVGALRNLW